MTNEEMLIELQNIVDIYEKEDMYPILMDYQISAIKTAIAALERTEPQWILCTDRLPDECTHVLVCNEDEVYINYFIDENNGWSIDDEIVGWMPLPDPIRR